jgi:hypothetical protein
MFLGHFALGFAAKSRMPDVSLGTLFLAAQLADLVWPVLVFAGIEAVEVRPGITAVTPLDFIHYPYSHSLLALCAWGLAFGLLYKAVRKASWPAVAALAALVVSHWLLDWVAHRPDLPLLLSGGEKLGLGLWHSLPATLAAEALLLAAGVALYHRSTRAVDRTGSIASWSLVAFLAIVYLASLFGPPPPSGAAVAGSALSMWLLVLWGYWMDRHRRPSGR